jgi:hypothetical protein
MSLAAGRMLPLIVWPVSEWTNVPSMKKSI